MDDKIVKILEDKFTKFYAQKDFRYRILKKQFDKFTERLSQRWKMEIEMNYINNVFLILNRYAVRK